MAPIVVFAYNRVDKIRRCLESLSACFGIEQTDLIVFSDGPKKENDIPRVAEVREYLKEFQKQSVFKSVNIVESEINKGLQKSIIGGVSDIINRYGSVIVLEDDLVVSKDFIVYMNDGLDYYRDKKQYGSINANTYPVKALKKYDKDVYVIRKADCWGWGTWSDRWNGVDWDVKDYKHYRKSPIERIKFNSLESGLDKMLCAQQEGKISSWAVRWVYSLYKRQLLSVYPRVSRAINKGFDGSGEHCETNSKYEVELYDADKRCVFEELPVDNTMAKAVARYPRRKFKDYCNSIRRKISEFFK